MEKLILIDGEFQQEEAREILMNVFSTKINFHQFKNFSSQERFGKEDETAIRRIPALKLEVLRLEKMLADAKSKNKKMIVRSEITISYVDAD